NAPKFPMPAYLDFLMDAAWEDEGVRKMVRHTLDEMAMGGMYDQVGGGFHRYSTDERWLVPHFEKMLYDNGQLLSTYARAYELTGDDFYARVALRTAEYVLREMRNEEGMFFSAQDAEVDHREGLNYLWTKEDVAKVLQDAGMQNDVEFALKVYGLNDGVNFTDPHHPEDGGKNVLFLRDRPEETAKGIGISVEEYSAKLDAVNETLLKVRNVRKQPITDDKVLTGWNGLMIAGLADAGRVLHEKTYLVAAHIAAETVSKMMIAEDGRLMRSARAGRVHVDAFLEDYALLAHGLIALHRATGNVRWIEEATELMKEAMNRFGDSERGGFFDVQEGRQELFVRTKGIHDGAVPSGNSVMLVNMHSLLEVTGETQWMHGFNIALSGISASVQESPTGSIVAASALWKFLSHTAELLPQKHANTAATLGPVSFRVLTRADASDGCRSVSIVLEIARGYHVNAHEPGVDGLIGLRIHALNDDAKLHVTYPEARRLDDENSPYVYENGDVITCMVESEQDVELAIRFQACNDRMCLAPATHIVKATLTS
ncbi:MAG TPA: protein-disulfide reductase DsbD domain-containing protein, partial [Phycisphaerales bacterium]|nr:protein-disulfide reductase DsbD domain-containing protein [Phycisphaerales bacterium]